MPRYRRIDPRVWDDEKFVQWDDLKRSLWLLLLTGPGVEPVPGLQCGGVAALAETLRRPTKPVAEKFWELVKDERIEVDERCRLIRTINAPIYNRPLNPNQVKGWYSAWESLPESPLKYSHIGSIRDACEMADLEYEPKPQKGKRKQSQTPFMDAFRSGFGKALSRNSSRIVPEQFRNSSQETISKQYLNDTRNVPPTVSEGSDFGGGGQKSVAEATENCSTGEPKGSHTKHAEEELKETDVYKNDRNSSETVTQTVPKQSRNNSETILIYEGEGEGEGDWEGEREAGATSAGAGSPLTSASLSETQSRTQRGKRKASPKLPLKQFTALVWETYHAERSKHYGPYTQLPGDEKAAAQVAIRVRLDVDKRIKAGKVAADGVDDAARKWLKRFWRVYFKNPGVRDALSEQGHPMRAAPGDLNGFE